MLKDLRLVQEHAQALSVPLPETALVTSQYVDARAHGEGGLGNHALFRVYDRMTNQATSGPCRATRHLPRPPPMSLKLDFAVVLARWQSLVDGAILTLELALVAIVLGSLIGIAGAIGRRSDSALARRIVGIYVEAIRNTPLLVQIFLVYFGLASLGFKLSAVVVAALALTINVGAYTTEIIRAGFDSIHRGQIEAAEGLALSQAQMICRGAIESVPKPQWEAAEGLAPSKTQRMAKVILAQSVFEKDSLGPFCVIHRASD